MPKLQDLQADKDGNLLAMIQPTSQFSDAAAYCQGASIFLVWYKQGNPWLFALGGYGSPVSTLVQMCDVKGHTIVEQNKTKKAQE